MTLLITSDLSVLIGPRFLSVSLMLISFRFLINTLSDFFSFFDKFCFSIMSVSKRVLMASLTFQQKLFTAVYSAGGTKLFLRHFFFVSQKPLALIPIQRMLYCSFVFVKSENLEKVLPVLVVSHLGINFVPNDQTLIVARFRRKLFDTL